MTLLHYYFLQTSCRTFFGHRTNISCSQTPPVSVRQSHKRDELNYTFMVSSHCALHYRLIQLNNQSKNTLYIINYSAKLFYPDKDYHQAFE